MMQMHAQQGRQDGPMYKLFALILLRAYCYIDAQFTLCGFFSCEIIAAVGINIVERMHSIMLSLSRLLL